MTRIENSLPIGFLGPVRAWGSLVPVARSPLVLPRERERLLDAPGAALFDLVEVNAYTESLGRIETTLAAITGRLIDGGVLLLDVDNVQGPTMLRPAPDRPASRQNGRS